MSGSLSRIRTKVIFLGLMFLSTAVVQADEGEIEGMLKTIDIRLGDANARQRSIEDGEERALLCQYCHGSDGNSLKPDVPNLAGQNAKYLLEQIDKFATRERDDFVMSELAENFTAEDKINVAIFYHSKTVKTQPAGDINLAKGKTLYHSVCSSCHGIEGRGNQKQARLAGQQIVYLMNVLKAFRNNANNPAARAESTRHSEIMESMTKDLSDEQIESVAAYIAQMP